MVLVLALGDLHIPHRTTDLPPKFKQLLVPGKIQHILCTGNLCVKEMYDYLKGICGDVCIAKGDFDQSNAYPEQKVLTIGQFRIGVCHGHQASDNITHCPHTLSVFCQTHTQSQMHASCWGHQVIPWGDVESLAMVARQMDVDILITGHTHAFTAYKYEDRFLINPGSATGAYSSMTEDVKPSFVLMDVDGLRATVYVYELVNGDVKVDKIEFAKPAAAPAS
eukprot:jgi/Chlat1/4477/Chrsp29S04426